MSVSVTKCQSFDRYAIKVTDCKQLNSATSWRFHSHIVLVWLGFGMVMVFREMRLFNYIERFLRILHLVEFFAWQSIYCIDRNSQIYKFCDVEQFMLFLQYESVESECFLKSLYIYNREHSRPVQRRVAPMLRLNGQTITI